jgi:hypothetical protein
MPLMQFYAVTDFLLSWNYFVNVGRVWWFVSEPRGVSEETAARRFIVK